MLIIFAIALAALIPFAISLPRSSSYGLGSAIPITKRSSLADKSGIVDFDALKSHIASVKAKIHLGLDNYEKNTGKSHPSSTVNGAIERRSDIPLTGYEHGVWYGNISVGTPPKNFTVLFDTGSSDFFLPSAGCDESCDGHKRWDPASSSTANDLGIPFELSYADGSTVAGEQYTDTVFISGFAATSQTLGGATTYSSQLTPSRYPPDGLLGMGFESISSFGASPVFETMVSDGQVANAQFSFRLSDKGGELTIGGSNHALYTGNFTYVSVTRQGYWEVTMDNVGGNGEAILSDVDTVIDTGTSVIAGEPSQVSTFYRALGGNSLPSDDNEDYYTFPCDKFPNITLGFGDKSFGIPFADFNLGKVSDDSNDCVGGIVGVDTGASFWIVGDVFLRGVYTTFDLELSRVGFANLSAKSHT